MVHNPPPLRQVATAAVLFQKPEDESTYSPGKAVVLNCSISLFIGWLIKVHFFALATFALHHRPFWPKLIDNLGVFEDHFTHVWNTVQLFVVIQTLPGVCCSSWSFLSQFKPHQFFLMKLSAIFEGIEVCACASPINT